MKNINGGGILEHKKISLSGIYLKILRMSHPEKQYQILCANCNWIKRVVENEVGARSREK